MYIYTIVNLYGFLGIPAGSPDLLQTAQKAHQVVSTLSCRFSAVQTSAVVQNQLQSDFLKLTLLVALQS